MADVTPQPDPPPNHRDARAVSDGLKQHFRGAIRPVRVPFLDRVNLFFVAIGMLALPALYLALTALVGYGIYYHAVHHVNLILVNGELALRLGFSPRGLIYVAPLLAGGILLAFMIKPLVNRGGVMELHRLSRRKDPLFYEFVEQVCRSVRAPPPRIIYITCDANAVADFKAGFLNFFLGRPVLIVGLPLLGGLNQRQLAGVLAREFAHFARGAGMSMTHVIRGTSQGFARAVGERDRFDEKLAYWLKSDLNIILRFPLMIAKTLIEITRGILWALMQAGHFIGGSTLRRMEFDADRYEARMAGSSVFEPTMRRIVALHVAQIESRHDLMRSWRERRLGDDFAAIVLNNVAKFPYRIEEAIDREFAESTTSVFDASPSMSARLKSVLAENAEGVFTHEAPVIELFSDFSALSRRVTFKFYQSMIGPDFSQRSLISTRSLIEEKKKVEEGKAAFRRFFQGLISLHHPLLLQVSSLTRPVRPREAAQALMDVRKQMEKQIEKARKAHKRLVKADAGIMEAGKTRALYRADLVRIKTMRQAEQEEAEHGIDREKALDRLARFGADAHERLISGLELLEASQVRSSVPRGEALAEEARLLLPALFSLCASFELIRDLHHNFLLLQSLIEASRNHEPCVKLHERIERLFSKCYQTMVKLKTNLDEQPYPFGHGLGKVSIADYFMDDIGNVGGYQALYEKNIVVIDHLLALYFRLLGRLAFIAEKVESTLGLIPWPEPPQDDDESEEEKSAGEQPEAPTF